MDSTALVSRVAAGAGVFRILEILCPEESAGHENSEDMFE